jgi:outer membrane protein insertion porin family
LNPRVRVPLGVFLTLCAVLGSTAQAQGGGDPSQDAPSQQPEVRDAKVEIEGSLAVSPETILDALGIRRGQLYNPQSVRKGIQDLWRESKVRVDDVLLESLDSGGVRVFVKVTAEQTSGAIEIRGNVAFEKKDLLEAAYVTFSASLDKLARERVARDLLTFYKDRGYVFADVRLTTVDQTAIYDVMEGPLVRIRSMAFEGNKAFPARTFLGFGTHLTQVMELHDKFLFFRGSEYSERKLRQDLVQLRKFYRERGYLDAVVEYSPPKFSESGSAVDLVILIDEGRLYRVASVDVKGVKSFPKSEVLSKVKLKPGDPYTWESVIADFRAIQRFYGEHGYPKHPSLKDSWRIVIPPETTIREDETEALVDVVYEILENSPKYVRDILIQGNKATQDRVIRRQLSFHPGELVDQPKIEQSIARLEALQYFDSTSTNIAYRYRDSADPAWKDVLIELAEGKTGSVSLSGGLSSNDGLFAVLSFTKRNFDLFNLPTSFSSALPEIIDGTAFTGAGQELNVNLAPGFQLSQYDIRFTEPDLFGDNVRSWFLSVDFYYRVRRYTENREDRLGQVATIGKELDDHWFTDFTIRNEEIKISDIEANAPAIIFAEEGTNQLRSLRWGVGFKDQDLPIEPTRGTNLRFDWESAGTPLAGDFNFQKTTALAREWFPLGKNSEGHPHTLFVQARVGVAFPTDGDTFVPYSERFFLGGEGSIRGFQFRGVGPVDQGTPIGGQAFYVGTVEYRFPIFATRLPGRDDDTEVFRGVIFNDFGSVGLNLHDPTLSQVRSSIGIGVRIRIPFLPQLPIAIHLAYPYLRESTDTLRALSFTIGQF